MKLGEYFNDIELLKSASDSANTVKVLQGYSDASTQVMQVAVAINHAVKCEERHTLWMRPMPAELKSKLEEAGYTVSEWERCAKQGDIFIIRW